MVLWCLIIVCFYPMVSLLSRICTGIRAALKNLAIFFYVDSIMRMHVWRSGPRRIQLVGQQLAPADFKLSIQLFGISKMSHTMIG